MWNMPNEVTSFPAEVAGKLKTYVYRLIDPRNGETFYVGKRHGDRVFMHIREQVDEVDEEGHNNEPDQPHSVQLRCRLSALARQTPPIAVTQTSPDTSLSPAGRKALVVAYRTSGAEGPYGR
jgi:hypothetical protein